MISKSLHRFVWVAVVLFTTPQMLHGHTGKPLETLSNPPNEGAGDLAGFIDSSPSYKSRDLWYRTLGLNDGLSQGFVKAMVQDRDGYIWFATLDGLNRYDGQHFEVFRNTPGDPATLSADAIIALHADAAGRLWVGTDKGLDRYDPFSGSFVHYYQNPAGPAGPSPGPVEFIETDQSGHVWFVSGSLNRLDPESGEIQVFPVGPGEDSYFTALAVDSRNRLWAAKAAIDAQTDQETGEYRLDVFDLGETAETGRLSSPILQFRSEVDEGPYTTILEGDGGHVWIGSERGGLIRFDPESRQISFARLAGASSPLLKGPGIKSLVKDPNASLWALVESESRLVRIDLETLKVESVNLRAQRDPRPALARFNHLFVDRTGGLWISLDQGGVLFADISSGGIELHRLGHGSSQSDFIRAIYKDGDGSLWVGTPLGMREVEREPRNTPTSALLAKASLGNLDVQAIHKDRSGRFWIGTARGLIRIEADTGEKTTIIPRQGNPGGLDVVKIDVIYEDSAGTLWFGTGNRGLLAILENDGPIVRYRHDPLDPESLPSNKIRAIMSDRAGGLWLGTAKGLVKAEPGPSGRLRFRRVCCDDPLHDPGDLLALAERAWEPGVLWLGWAGLGLTRLDTGTGVARHWASHDSALPNDTMYAILADDQGQLWMSTNNGLVRFDPYSESFRTFGSEQLLQSLEFNHRAAFHAPDGELFFGGIAGLNAFYPDRIRGNPFPPQVRINRVLVLDRSGTQPAAPFVPRFNMAARDQDLVFGPRERDLRFEFAALHFASPDHNRFSYRLEPYDSGWREPTGEDHATYTNLNPGRYTFRVRALSSQGVWSETDDRVAFTIRAPFYETTWFLGLGLFLLGAAVLGVHKSRLILLRRRAASLEGEVAARTRELKDALNLVENQARRLEELDKSKSRFFANISHELRTPLTLTLGPLEELRRGRHGALSRAALSDVELALSNTRQQLELVDQLLTLTALESNSMPFVPRRARLDDAVRAVASRFLSHAESLDLQLHVALPLEPVWYPFDEEKVDQIISNLLSNACKYNSPGGRITLRMKSRPDAIVIRVEDTGIGISREDQDRVFERFYRAGSEHSGRPGTGIGLALVRELVELHGGRVGVESRPGKGATFIVEFPRPPVRAAHGKPYSGTSGPERSPEEPAVPRPVDGDDLEAGRQTVLVVEDHPDMLAFLRGQLSEQYSVIEADNARTGLALAAENMPDLVISDVMMDGMDGFEFCAALRDDAELAHLPVVLLTARADRESRLEGLGKGADDYLVKPFDRQELLLRVQNLLRSRLRLRDRLLQESRQWQEPAEPPAPVSPDEEFLDRLRHILQTRAYEESFSVSDLASGLAMSRAKLYRRVAETCDSTPSQLILEVRLERAAQLLREQAGNVGEIAYGVGFRNVSHFISRFRERFGATPASYAAQAAAQPPAADEDR